jgi:transcriptional regulator with XRE-family HTH domain
MKWADYVTEKSEAVNQADLAERLGVSQSTISRWMRSKNEPTVENVIDFARAVGDSPVAALVMFGFLRESEVGEVVRVTIGADQLESHDLLAELGRRLGISVVPRGREVRGA